MRDSLSKVVSHEVRGVIVSHEAREVVSINCATGGRVQGSGVGCTW